MPTMLHEALVGLFRACPELGAQVTRCVTKVPRFARAKADDASFPQHVAPERHADAAVRLVDRHDKPRLGLIVEVQLSVEPFSRTLPSRPSWSARTRSRGSPISTRRGGVQSSPS
jgi:hypothetical protein